MLGWCSVSVGHETSPRSRCQRSSELPNPQTPEARAAPEPNNEPEPKRLLASPGVLCKAAFAREGR